MKKLLALVLALVMVMGLMTVGASAKTEYSDKADFNFEEAIAVMSSIGVLEGADGKFRPAAELKRSEAAKIVAYLYYNNKTAAGLVGTGKFSDVPANHWAAGYVDTLASSGIVAGTSATTFNPDGDLKAIDFAKMLLVCIGFDAKIEGLVGADYQINTSKLANQAGLFNGLKDLKAGDVLTREQAAQMAFNAIKAATVEYSNKGGEISLNGATVSLGSSNFNYVTTTIAKDATNIDDRILTNAGINLANTGYTIEFGERQYPDLKQIKTTDDFGRPANEWVNNKENIGKFVNKDCLMGTFSTSVTGADLFTLIGEAKIKNSKNIHYLVNGCEFTYVTPTAWANHAKDPANEKRNLTDAEFYRIAAVDRDNMIRSNKVPYAFTGNGVLTEVYEKDDDLYIVSIVTYYAEADGDYNAKTGKAALKNLSWDDHNNDPDKPAATEGVAPTFSGTPNGYIYAEDLKTELVPALQAIKDKDPLLIRYAYNKTADKYVVVELETPKSDSSVALTKYSVGRENMSTSAARAAAKTEDNFFYTGYVVTGGAQKDFSKAVKLAKDLKSYNDTDKPLDSNYALYYDQFGYVINVKQLDTSAKYVFISGINGSNSNLGVTTADAFAIFADGTSATIKVNVSKTNEKIRDYQVARGAGNSWKSGSDSFTLDANVSLQYSQFLTDESAGGTALVDGVNMTNPYGYNRWFTFSTSGEGANAVYTLSPAGNSIAVADLTGNNTTKNNVNPGLLVINTKTARLSGDNKTYGTGVTGTLKTVYGNEKTVYITAKSGKVSPAAQTDNKIDAGNYRRAISEVTGIYTGIQSVDITAFAKPNVVGLTDKQMASRSVFTESAWAVYDKDGYIVAAVVNGSDGGNTGNYVYAISQARSQWKEGSYYYWDFNAIVDGEEKVMTVKTEYTGTIDSIKDRMGFDAAGHIGSEGALFNMTLDKDGYVTAVTPIYWSTLENNNEDESKVYNNDDLAGTATSPNNYSKKFEEEKVYNTYFHANDTYECKGNTLFNQFNGTNPISAQYTNTGYAFEGDIGLTIASGAPIYVVQQQRVKSTGQVIELVEKFSDFNKALGALTIDANGNQAASKDFATINGYVSAVLNSNGTAKWVVIKDVTKVVGINNQNEAATTNTGLAITATPAALNHTITVNPTAGGAFTTGAQIKYVIYGRPLGASTYTEVTNGSVVIDSTAGATTAGIIFNDGGAAGIPVGFTTGASYYVVLTYPDNTTAATAPVGAL